MPELIVNPRFRDVTRPLKQEEYNALEENILRDGRVYSAIITWKNQIVDGHNRWSIIQKHPEIPYTTEEMSFPDEWAVEAWICATQLGRRNLTDEERTYMIARQYEAQKQSVSNITGKNQYTEEVEDQNGPQPQEPRSTAEKIARQHGIGKTSVKRAVHFAEGVDAAEKIEPGAKEAILSGESKVPKSVIAELPKMEPEQQKKIVRIATSGNPWDKLAAQPKPVPKGTKKIIADTAATLYDTERVVEHSVDDLVDDLNLIIEEFIRKVNRSIQTYDATLTEEGAEEKVIATLEDAETKIEEIKEMFS